MTQANTALPKVSIVVPVFRGMPYLTALIDSIKKQTYQNLELIATITPSGDGSEEVLTEAGFAIEVTPEGTRAVINHGPMLNSAERPAMTYPVPGRTSSEKRRGSEGIKNAADTTISAVSPRAGTAGLTVSSVERTITEPKTKAAKR